MAYRKRYFAVLLAILSGTVLSLSPVWPHLDLVEVVETQARRVDHERAEDFADGRREGALVLRNATDSVSLTLDSPNGGAYHSPVIDLAMAASALALHWTEKIHADGAISLALRTSVDGLAWSDWHDVEGEGQVAVAQGRKVFGTMVAAEGARYAQYRIAIEGRGADLPAIYAVSVFGFNSATAPARSEWRLALGPRDRALATIKPLGIVSRRQWGADERLRFQSEAGSSNELIWPEEVATVEKIVVHHTAGPNVCASPDPYCQRRSVVAINDIYYYHAVVNGWGDIGYNSLVGYDGRIYEGRHGPGPEDGEPLTLPVVAGHALRHNNRTHGVALMGDFSQEPVPDLQYDALARVVGWVVKSRFAVTGAIDPLGFSKYEASNGEVSPPLPNIIGHRDVNETECPGDYLYERLIQLRHLAQRLVEWPPVNVALRARPQGDTIAYHILVDNHEPDVVQRLIVKGAVPANVEFVDSWAGSPYTNRGVFDGSVVTWYDADARLDPGRDRREYVFIVRPRPDVARGDVRTSAWVQFAGPAQGVATSELVSAEQGIEVIADPVVDGRTTSVGVWPISRNVAGYYNDAYQYHDAGDGTASFMWEVALPEAGQYEVSAWWSHARDRATNAPYVVYATDGPHAVRVNQRERGQRWINLGTYVFAAGPVRVTLGDDADGVVIADAIRFRKTPE